MLTKPCLLLFACPGDKGDTVVYWRGEARAARKDDPIVKLYGALDTAIAASHKAANVLPRPQSRVMRLIAFSLMELGFYLATGRAEYLDTATALYKRALKKAYSTAPEEPLRSWIACASPECSAVDEARVWIRWVERRATSLEGTEVVVKLLNQLSNLAFEVMRTLPHIEYRHRPVV
ncbi:MAG: ATP:cob(I)alamin adenosyltransferase [Pyrobaculum sp.]|uniref:ATP:cob(I)alamin adenosyltransferase n=3 Tax=Pyrobaculum TaxID=2276 RepID=A4WJ01_PYRAR|nr:ATP:cob(I)alamin adenosyltransferase [Pyrobaculum arsenaticum]ABP50368.1 ATP:cob(I)alamin adenosyltransferase [Pyrobaculum arsenaticum DSM 13514]MCY0890356.1 ATP:cob(I)alamin adenosyltransferase [Pyrobaculum arsenaticum]NYR14687.1 ATP:cob(I)alamin adenosyltransferase [Pyrobaculum arsenaticum]